MSKIFLVAKEAHTLGLETGKSHCYLVYETDTGARFVTSLTDVTVEAFPPGLRFNVTQINTPYDQAQEVHDLNRAERQLDFGGRNVDAVWSLITEHALEIKAEAPYYYVLTQNSTSFIASLLNVVGLDFVDNLPGFNGNHPTDNPQPDDYPGLYNLLDFDYRLVGTAADDIIRGAGGNDILWGENGDDTLWGRGGADSMFGGAGNDVFGVDNVGDGVYENVNEGTDTVISTLSYALGANVENLTLLGSTAIYGTGNTLDNVVTGNEVSNVLIGGLGNDTLNGGTGVDEADFSGAFRQYHLTGNAAASASLSGPEGTDTLTGMENLAFVDGNLTFDAHDHMAQAYRLYFAALDRAPDTLGLEYWSRQLDAGASLEQVASGFVSSAEFQSKYGNLDNTAFVNQLYLNVLDRPADPGGLAAWVGALNAGVSRAGVVVGFSESPEHIQNHLDAVNAGLWDIDETAASVARLYFGVLERAPEVAGLTGWTDLIDHGTSLTAVANGFAQSPEFQTHYGSLDNGAFVNQLYLNVLDRPADPGGLANWVNYLNSGASRGQVALGFTESAEYQIDTLPQIAGGIHVYDLFA